MSQSATMTTTQTSKESTISSQLSSNSEYTIQPLKLKSYREKNLLMNPFFTSGIFLPIDSYLSLLLLFLSICSSKIKLSKPFDHITSLLIEAISLPLHMFLILSPPFLEEKVHLVSCFSEEIMEDSASMLGNGFKRKS